MCFPALLAAVPAAGAAAGAGGAAAAGTAAAAGAAAAGTAAATAATAGAVAGSAGAAAAAGGVLGTGLTTTQLLGLGSAIFSAGSTVAAGQAQAQAGKANAKIAEREGLIQATAASREQQELNKRRRAVASSQAAIGAKQGRAPTGSFLDVQGVSDTNAELDILSSVYGGALAVQSGNFRAKTARAGARGARTAGLFGGAGTLLTGGVQAFG